jgi:Kef-type K+ transport system membrane component KefB
VGFGFLTPFFFIGVGAGLDVSILRSFPAAVFSLFLGAMVFATKLFPVALARLLGLSVREALGMSLLLSAPLSMMVVAGALGLRMGLLTPEHNAALVFAALLASVVYPYFFRRLAPGFSRSPGTQRSGPHAGG